MSSRCADLKDILEKVESRLVVVKYIHVALAFVYWAVVVSSFYVTLMILKKPSAAEVLSFWVVAIVLYYPLWMRTKKILGLNFRTFASKIALMSIFIILCLMLPDFLQSYMDFKHAVGVTILCSVSAYLFVLALTVRIRRGEFPKETLPAILSFAFAPAILFVSDPLTFTGFVIVTTYGITALLYLIKAIGVVEE